MLSKLLNVLFGKNKEKQTVSGTPRVRTKKKSNVSSTKIGDIGEYKINIQLDQLPSGYRYLSDIMVKNSHAGSGYSQIDHIVISPYAIFVIETKNYTGTIYGDRERTKWSVNGKYAMMNPFNQNYGHIQAVKKILGLDENKHFISIVSFNRRSTFKVAEGLRKIQSDDLIVYDTELTEYITRKVNVIKLVNQIEVFTKEDINRLYEQLEANNIMDVTIRAKHVETLNSKK